MLYLGRAPRTKETLLDFHEWRRVTRHPLVFRGLTSSQRTLRNWGVTKDAWNAFVSRYSSLEFQEWSRLQSEKAKSNEYRHHSSRHGFVNVEEKIVCVEYLVLHH